MQLNLFGKPIQLSLNGLNVSRRLEYALLCRYLDLQNQEILLDVACGDGYWSAKFASRAKRVFGFDYNRMRLLQAKRRPVTFGGLVGCDAHFLPFKEASFSAAVGVCVLEHFADDLKALQELCRTLKPGAKLALTVDSFSYPGITDADRLRHARNFSVKHWYRRETLHPLLEQAGFEVLKSVYLLKTPLTAMIYQLHMASFKLAYLLFPIVYPLSWISERLATHDNYGYKMAVLVKKR
jgi:SAM-dependent methyltransferase